MKKAILLVAATGIALLFQGGAFAHEGESHGKKYHDTRMERLHKIMPLYAQVQVRINEALEKEDAAAVEAESGKILTTISDLKKSKPHRNHKNIGTFMKIADSFGLEVRATVDMAKKGDIAGARAAFRKAGELCNKCHSQFRD